MSLPNPYYMTVADLTPVMKSAGVLFVADTDDDGDATGPEEVAILEAAITYAGTLIDAAVSPHMEPTYARATGSEWLRDRCLDIAVHRAVTAGGRASTLAIDTARDDAMTLLQRIADGRLRVPNITYPPKVGQSPVRRVRGVPRTFNPK